MPCDMMVDSNATTPARLRPNKASATSSLYSLDADSLSFLWCSLVFLLLSMNFPRFPYVFSLLSYDFHLIVCCFPNCFLHFLLFSCGFLLFPFCPYDCLCISWVFFLIFPTVQVASISRLLLCCFIFFLEAPVCRPLSSCCIPFAVYFEAPH